MEQINFSKKKKRYTHLKERERYKIEVWLEAKKSVPEIAKDLGKHKTTIYREINRGTISLLKSDLSRQDKYRADVSQLRSEERAKNKERALKIGNDKELEKHIRQKLIKDKYSPDVIIGEIKVKGLKFEGMICTKTLYNYIESGIFTGISNETLWEKRKRKKRKYKSIRRVSVKNRLRRSIEERPTVIEKRNEYGHWEGDCVKGKIGSKESLFTLTERKTLEEIIIKLNQATQENITKAIDGLEKKYKSTFKNKFKSITFDNGSEFLNWKYLERSIFDHEKPRTVTYYAHPYSSWERGSNENQNRMIRRFIPKGTNLKKISLEEIKIIEEWMNNYPRKKLGYKSANELVKECLQNIN
jgi:IS30 family transposase